MPIVEEDYLICWRRQRAVGRPRALIIGRSRMKPKQLRLPFDPATFPEEPLSRGKNARANKLAQQDRAFHDWYRFVLFRTRFATATKEQLREEVVVLHWPGRQSTRTL